MPMDYKTGGSGYVLYLDMIRHWIRILLIMFIFTIPIYYYICYIYNLNYNNPDITNS